MASKLLLVKCKTLLVKVDGEIGVLSEDAGFISPFTMKAIPPFYTQTFYEALLRLDEPTLYSISKYLFDTHLVS